MPSVLRIDRSSTRVRTQKHADIIHADRTRQKRSETIHSAEDSADLELIFQPDSRGLVVFLPCDYLRKASR